MKCQRLVSHHDAYTHRMAGYEQPCRRNAKTTRQITSGKTVEVCNQHAKEIDYRLASNFFKTPDTFFTCPEDQP